MKPPELLLMPLQPGDRAKARAMLALRRIRVGVSHKRDEVKNSVPQLSVKYGRVPLAINVGADLCVRPGQHYRRQFVGAILRFVQDDTFHRRHSERQRRVCLRQIDSDIST